MPSSQTILNRKSLCWRYQLWVRCAQELPTSIQFIQMTYSSDHKQPFHTSYLHSTHKRIAAGVCVTFTVFWAVITCYTYSFPYIVFVKQLYCWIGTVAVLLSVGTWPCRGIVVCRYLALSQYCCVPVPGPVAVLLCVGTWPCHGIVVCRYLALSRYCCLSVPGPVAVLLSVDTWPCRGIVVCRYVALSRYCYLSVPGPVAVLFVGTWPCFPLFTKWIKGDREGERREVAISTVRKFVRI